MISSPTPSLLLNRNTELRIIKISFTCRHLLNPCQMHWSLFFSWFNFYLHYCLENGKTESLSQPFDPEDKATEPQFITDPSHIFPAAPTLLTTFEKLETFMGLFFQAF